MAKMQLREDGKNFILKLDLQTASGMRAKHEYRVTVEQWVKIVAVCEGTDK